MLRFIQHPNQTARHPPFILSIYLRCRIWIDVWRWNNRNPKIIKYKFGNSEALDYGAICFWSNEWVSSFCVFLLCWAVLYKHIQSRDMWNIKHENECFLIWDWGIYSVSGRCLFFVPFPFNEEVSECKVEIYLFLFRFLAADDDDAGCLFQSDRTTISKFFLYEWDNTRCSTFKFFCYSYWFCVTIVVFPCLLILLHVTSPGW